MTMFGEFTLPLWTLFVLTFGYVLGWAAGRSSAKNETDDGPGAATADELDSDHG